MTKSKTENQIPEEVDLNEVTEAEAIAIMENVKEVDFFDETIPEKVDRVSMKGDPDGKKAKRMPMHPDEPTYAGLGTQLVAYWPDGTELGGFKNYKNVKNLHKIVSGIIDDRRRALRAKRNSLSIEMKELKGFKAPEREIKAIQAKIDTTNEKPVFAFRHTAYGVWKHPGDIASMVPPTKTLQDITVIRTFKSEEEVEKLNDGMPLLMTQHKHPIKFKWVIV